MSTKELKAAATGKVTKAKDQTLAGLMADPKIKQQLELAMPKHMTADRLARIATTEIRKVPKLAICDKTSFLGAIMQCAQLGLEPGGALGHAYLIPFENRKKNITEVQFIVGYRGMIDLARRSGQIISLSARTAHEHDEFHYEFGLHETIKHVPADGERGSITHVYAVANLQGGGVQFDVMSKADIDKVKATSMSASRSDSPWQKYYEEMAKKTVIRRLFKYLPASIEMTRAVIADERADAGLSQDNASVITGEFSEVDDEPAQQEEPAQPKDSVAPTYAEVAEEINKAKTFDDLDFARGLMKDVADEKQRNELNELLSAKAKELTNANKE